MLSVGDFGHINNMFLMKTALLNAGEKLHYCFDKIEHFCNDKCIYMTS